MTTTIAIIKEEKIPQDTRTPITPVQARQIIERFSSIKLICQSSNIRCFTDDEYKKQGIEIVENVQEADILLGVKEVKIENLNPGKTYLFFSHTIKKQPYNRKLLQAVVERNVRLIDYECLTNEKGIRVIAFGRWAGIVGVYNAFWTYGQKYGEYSIKRAFECHDLNEIYVELKKVALPPIKILITGNGRVSRGGLEILEKLKVRKVDPEQFINRIFEESVYCQVDVDVYTKRIDGSAFRFKEFFSDPTLYESNFQPFYGVADVMIMAAYWDPNAPRLFVLKEAQGSSFNIKVIADITCDIDGSVPTTTKATAIDNPVYDLDLQTLEEKPAFSGESNLSVMSIDNLPNELPRDASQSFGNQMIDHILKPLISEKEESIIENATITKDGYLTPKFEYLRDYLEGE